MEPSNFCSFFIKQKSRKCNFECLQGEQFCHYHINPNQDLQLIPCPLDPLHTIQKNNLEKHLKICSSKKQSNSLENNIWFSKNINIKQQESEQIVQKDEKTINKRHLQFLYQTKSPFLTNLITKIENSFEKALEIYSKSLQKETSVNFLKEYLLDIHQNVPETTLTDKQKDQQQVIQLLKTLKNNNLIDTQSIYIEFGAGKGLLSHVVALQLNQKEDLTVENVQQSFLIKSSKSILDNYNAHILLELEPRRNKVDKLHRNNKFFFRFRTNILDFDVNSLKNILLEKEYNKDYSVIGISKHMCGQGTDLSINTLLNGKEEASMKGFMIATCCHHKCEYNTYINREFLINLGFNEEELKIFFIISSWYISKMEAESENEWISSERKAILGKMVKRIVDIGRALCLFSQGKQCQLVKYCDSSLSPENFVILCN